MTLSNALIREVSRELDKNVKLPAVMELVDRPMFNFALKQLRDKYWANLSDENQQLILTLLEAFASEDYSALPEDIAEVICALVDMPWIKHDAVGMAVMHMVQLLLNLILGQRYN